MRLVCCRAARLSILNMFGYWRPNVEPPTPTPIGPQYGGFLGELEGSLERWGNAILGMTGTRPFQAGLSIEHFAEGC